MSSPPPEPSWRKPIGILGLIVYLIVYALAISAFADTIGDLPNLLAALVYLVAGIAWVAPLRPLFLWMNTGHWTQPGHSK